MDLKVDTRGRSLTLHGEPHVSIFLPFEFDFEISQFDVTKNFQRQ